jgi:hypothetical protein
MPDALIVVQAKCSAAAACDHEVCQRIALESPVYGFDKGELGVLELRNNESMLWTRDTYVLWDGDPDRQARKTVFDEVEIIGIQIEGRRVLLQPR